MRPSVPSIYSLFFVRQYVSESVAAAPDMLAPLMKRRQARAVPRYGLAEVERIVRLRGSSRLNQDGIKT